MCYKNRTSLCVIDSQSIRSPPQSLRLLSQDPYRRNVIASRLSTRAQPLGGDASTWTAISRPLCAGSKASPSVILICSALRPRATLMMSLPSRSRSPMNVAPDLTTTRHSASPGDFSRSSALPSSIGTLAQNGQECPANHSASQARRFHQAAFRPATVCLRRGNGGGSWATGPPLAVGRRGTLTPIGVGPWGPTVSCGSFDRLGGLFLLEAFGAQVAKSGV